MKSDDIISRFRQQWRWMRSTKGFHSFVQYLAFIFVATLFWLVLSLNDSVTRSFDMRLVVDNVPDTVTFINDPPATFHVTVRDKGTNLLRNGMFSTPTLSFNFRDYAHQGLFRVSREDFNSSLKALFGPNAQISATSIDSLRSVYSTAKGRRVPIVVRADVSAAPGSVVSTKPVPLQRYALLYSSSNLIDTVTRIYTEPIILRNLSETQDVEVKLKPIEHSKVVPGKIKVKISVEPLVKKESMVTVRAENVPDGQSLLLFPSRVQVVYFVPMSMFNSDLVPIDVIVDYLDTRYVRGKKLPVRIGRYYDYVESPRILLDSVEYSIVKQ